MKHYWPVAILFVIFTLTYERGRAQENSEIDSVDFSLGQHFEESGDYALAFANYKRASDAGSAAAALKIAQLYESGKIGVGPNRPEQAYDAALPWYRTAAARGNAEARLRLDKGAPGSSSAGPQETDNLNARATDKNTASFDDTMKWLTTNLIGVSHSYRVSEVRLDPKKKTSLEKTRWTHDVKIAVTSASNSGWLFSFGLSEHRSREKNLYRFDPKNDNI